MSLYGNVRRIGSQSFQFDRIYHSRCEMDAANSETSDGVHVGRFVLIEYGERYTLDKDENGEIRTVTRQEFDGEELVDVTYPKWVERDEFKETREADLAAYGANYDSTVWQKIFTEQHEKYIMIAELNAVLPKLDMTVEGALIYKQKGEDEEASEVYDAFNNKVDNVVVTMNQPYFDQIQDTEMAYLLHYPKPIELNVDSKSVDYNADGFNVFYDYSNDPTESYIHWTTNDFYGYNYDVNGKKITSGNIKYPKTQLTALMTGRTLRMHIPAFGNAINDLYDILYGHATYERDPLTNKILYKLDADGNEIIDVFGNKIPQIAYFRTPYNHFMDANGNVVDDSNNIIDDATGEIIEEGAGGLPIVDALRPYFKQYRDNYPYIMDLESGNPPDPTDIIRNPITDTLDGMYWTKDVPGIDSILSNNSSGLAALLSDMFGVKNPLTGEVKYWLLNDWTSDEYNEEGNTPTIRNKPETIAALTNTVYTNLDDLFDKHGENTANDPVLRKNWLRGTEVIESTKIPIIKVNEKNEIDEANSYTTGALNYVEDYKYYNVIKRYKYKDDPTNKELEPLEAGHWYTDISTWTMQKNMDYISGGLSPATLTVNVLKAYYAPNTSYKDACQNNLDKVSSVVQNGTTITVTCNFNELQEFSLEQSTANKKKWVGINFSTNYKDITKLQVNHEQLNQKDVDMAEAMQLKLGEFIYWIDATVAKEADQEVAITKLNGMDVDFVIHFVVSG